MQQIFIPLLLLLFPSISISLFASSSISTMTSSLPSNNEPIYNLRRYQPSQDDQGIKDLFTNNLIEEWGTRYHDGIYIENAKRYVDSVVNDSDSDVNNIEQTYFCKGGFFWVLTYCANGDGNEKEEMIVGTCGLQRISDTEAELRRLFIQ